MDSLPPTLYKYFGPERVDVFSDGLIRYTPLGAFNDPFEGQPDVKALATDAKIKEIFTTVLPQEARNAYEDLPSGTRTAIPYELWEKLIFEQMKSKENYLLDFMRESAPVAQNLLNQKFNKYLGAFCLSEVPDNLLMWSHYGASHTGFVLAFNAKHPYFHEEKGHKDEFRHLRRVVYREARPSATLTDLNGVDFFLVKSIHWSYEREWRIFRALSEADVVHVGVPFDTHLFHCPPKALQAVIIGARASVQTTQAIISGVRSNSALSHVCLRRARPDDSHFLLRIIDEIA